MPNAQPVFGTYVVGICLFLPFVQILESTQKDFRDLTGYGGWLDLEDISIVMLNSEMVVKDEETAVDSRTVEKKSDDPCTTFVANSSEGMIDEIYSD